MLSERLAKDEKRTPRERRKMNICPGDFVLEIGSGHNPKPRANVLCDKFIEDDEQRGGGIVADRPLVAADGQYLPFADSAFDYVICSHVLEHVEEPALLIAELMRVAKRGYIETPSEIAERIYGWPYHHWVVNKIDGRLVLQKKEGEAANSSFGQLFHTLAAEDKQWKRFHLTHHHLFLVQYEWEGEIDYELLPPGKSPLDLESPETLAALSNAYPKNQWLPLIKNAVPHSLISHVKTAVGALYRTRRKLIGEKHLSPNGIENKRVLLEKILVCPLCKGEILWLADSLQCETCERNYPIINGIPRLTV